ncbi:MAG: hypothetical protein V2A79_08270 [Planctomycetota bacterium]
MRPNLPLRRSTSGRIAMAALLLLLPILMGGCPEFQDESVAAIETASRGVLNAGLDLFFDQFRTDAAK